MFTAGWTTDTFRDFAIGYSLTHKNHPPNLQSNYVVKPNMNLMVFYAIILPIFYLLEVARHMCMRYGPHN